MCSVVEIFAGEFEIGDDLIPNASPRHRRRLRQSIWIDVDPITWAHFEVFVAAGGYRRHELWIDDAGMPLPCQRDQSVDSRCRAILNQAELTSRLLSDLAPTGRERPLTGVNWFEARAIASFYGARLPFEIEWEIAMRESYQKADLSSPLKSSTNRLCCHSCVGLLQEWVGDAFAPKYWRSDFDRVGIPWSATLPESPVVVRGSSADDLIQHISCRRGTSPAESYEFRSFRRVWDQPPIADLTIPKWRSFEQV